ncbi:formate dehydrogenase accessory sulfurtransferase FdhD [Geoglobus acetivorans]|uniref:Formate dehydrogenase accessory sulfurtransferase FdhD n=1 Tax=Geoglobus acetivorans TaxID=565033 RepID=A0ABZ3H0Y5_GEOAI|nr:formate dehydrogenase accessory sulfurtransferase FdhD [Geoglobus acetivorans]
MEVFEVGKRLEIGKEFEFKIIVGNRVIRLFCTPVNLEELVMGFLITEGLSSSPEVIVEGDVAVAKVDRNFDTAINSSGCAGVYVDEKLNPVKPGFRFSMSFIEDFIEKLEGDYYRRTRAYHTALIVSKNGDFVRAFDVGRHNAVDKAIGLAYRNRFDFSSSFLLLSGRITAGIVKKCIRAGIPLVVSKAAILDLAVDYCKKYGLSAISFATGLALNSGAIEV